MILKHCPSLAAALLDLYNAFRSSGSVPTAWKVGVIRLIPKSSAEEEPRNPSNFRPTALTPLYRKTLHHQTQESMAVIHVTKRLHGHQHPKGLCEWYPWLCRAPTKAGNSITRRTQETPHSHYLLPRSRECLWECPPQSHPLLSPALSCT